MILSSDKEVICVKDIPSNLISEAIFILKPNVVEHLDVKEEKTKAMLLQEAEEIVEDYLTMMKEEQNKKQVTHDFFAQDWKKEAIYIMSLFAILAICIAVVM